MPIPQSPSTLAVQALYLDHHGWLLQLLRRKLGHAEHAADLAQDTFMRLIQAGAAPGLREPRAWLTTVATRLAAQHFRRQALEQAYLDALARLPEEHAPSPESRALVLEALAAVGRVLDGLSARAREAFLLSQLDGLTYAQIAQLQGVTVNAVQKAMVRAYAHCYAAVYG